MADNNFRSYPNRAAGALTRAQQDDPLAELARLIGQTDAQADSRPNPRGPTPAYDEAAANPDWAADDRNGVRYPEDDRYAAPAATEDYDAAYDDRYQQPRGASLESYRPGGSADDDQEGGGGGKPASALSTRLNGGRDFARDYYVPPEQSRFGETTDPHGTSDARVPAVPAQAQPDERFEFDDLSDEAADDRAYAVDEYQDEENPARRGHRGIFVVAIVLGLAVIGTAGAFAYRAMFGSSMLPTLPPIIKADDGPNKIIPAKPKTSSDQAAASDTSSGEKLVSREEQPVTMPAPVNATPRVVSTIPIFPDPNSAQAGVPNSAQAGIPTGQGMPAAAPVPPPTTVATPPQANSIWPPVPPSAGESGAPSLAPARQPATATSPRKVRTVVIHSDQLGPMTADASAAPMAEQAPAAAALRAPPRTAMPVPARQAAVGRADANAPLSIIPGQDEAPAPRLRTALARPAEAPARAEPASMANGSYAVQVTSQRSEAEAKAEFRTLKAKFPSQLGGHEAVVRRADLGAKGVYYRALVGPFASAEQA
ncbi:MAG: SPOR domain-containing protein, partial [Xanthobacteraceae bacterium]